METELVSKYGVATAEGSWDVTPDFGERETAGAVWELGVRRDLLAWMGLCDFGEVLDDTPLTGRAESDRAWGSGRLWE